MGGRVALTIRASETEQYRGSCHTNVLPFGLFDPRFYVDLDSSRRHAWSWIQMILESRRLSPALNEMWGGHDLCAPEGYGIVVVDYVTSTLVSAQGYSSPNRIHVFSQHPADEYRQRWNAMESLGLLVEEDREAYDWQSASIRLPFSTSRIGDVDQIDQDMVDMVDRTVGISDEERASWASWISEHVG